MKIRRYIGKDIQEAMLKVKMDIGNEAVVLNTKKIRQKGFFKFFSKPLIEVLVAIDENKKNKEPIPTRHIQNNAIPNERIIERPNDRAIDRMSDRVHDRVIDRINDSANDRVNDRAIDRTNDRGNDRTIDRTNDRSIDRINDRAMDRTSDRINDRAAERTNDRTNYINNHSADFLYTNSGLPKNAEKDKKMNVLEDKVSKMEEMLEKIYKDIKVLPTNEKTNSDTRTIDRQEENTNNRLQKLLQNNLLRNDIDPELVNKIMDTVLEKIGDSTSMNQVASIVFSTIKEMLGMPETISLKENDISKKSPTVVIFIGPTGVGKTTTLAKIAANYSLNHKKKVGLITADTYRIAAVDQLKTYADILGLPVTVVYSSTEIRAAIENYSDKDIILVDTAGRSTKEAEQFEELKNLVAAANADEVYLVLSSTTSMSNCKQIIDSYNFLENYKLIFTKLDETSVIGMLLNTRYYTNRSLSYVTTGQSVPDDIEIVDTDKLTKSLLGSIQR